MTLPRSPFMGLAAFGDSEYDRLLFFGRERESELVAANMMASRLTVLYGPSGVGKTSLLRAGVARRLRALVPAGAAGADSACVAIVDRWRDDPVGAVAAAAGARTDVPLPDALAERALELGELYLVLDQMEEYVLYHGRDGGPLADELEEVLTRPDLRVHVLLGVRDDALADLDTFKRRVPGLFGNVLRLDHLTRAAARTAIEGPLRVYGELGGVAVTAEPELVEAVLEQVGAGRIERGLTGKAILDDRQARRVEAPYLQLVLERLWDVERERGSDLLRAATLAELGGADRIVEEHLERALARRDAGSRDLVAELFNYLVTPSGTKIAHAVEDLARYAEEDPARLEPVLAGLDAARILRRVPGRAGGPPRYEIFHDVLAPAILAWRARHEAERALERERAAARRRHRRIAAVAAAALVALAATTALALWALSQRADAREKAAAAEAGQRVARARELDASALLELGRDPERGLALALRAARLAPSAATEDVLRRALRESRVRTVARLGAPVRDLAALPGGTLAAVTANGGVRLVDGGALGREVIAPRRGSQTWLAGRNALTLRGTRLTVRRLPEGTVVATVPVLAGTRYAAAGPGLNRFVVAGRRGASLIRSDGRLLEPLPHPARVERAAFSPNGLLIATAGADGDAVLWDGAGRQRHVFRGADDSRIFDVAFSRLSRLLATAGSDGTARVWNVRTGGRVSIMPLHGSQVRRASFGVNEDALLTASRDRTARTWKVDTGGPRAVFAGHEDTVTAAVLLPGDRLGTASEDGTVRTWLAQLQPPLRPAPSLPAPRPTRDPRATIRGDAVVLDGVQLTGHRDDVLSVEVSPDGRRVVTASEDGDARIWDARTGETVHVLRGHVGTVFDASFSPDGRWVVTAGATTAGLWDATTGEFLYFLQGHRGPLRAAAFDAPTRIVTSGGDGVRAYVCDTCGARDALLRLAERRLQQTGRG
jgi:WD40 repeat protein